MLKFLRRLVATIDHVGHVRSQNERRSVSFEIAKHLSVTEEFTEIDMEQMTGRLDHDVIVMAITNTENVRCHAITSARGCKIAHSPLVFER